MVITNPTLIPRDEYVEVEVDGVRQYMNATTGVLMRDEIQSVSDSEDADPDADRDAILIDHEIRIAMIELGVNEDGTV